MNCSEFELFCHADPRRNSPREYMEHLDACPGCAELRHELRALDRSLAELLTIEPPVGLVKRIRTRQRMTQWRSRLRGGLPAWLLVHRDAWLAAYSGALTVALLLVVVWIPRGSVTALPFEQMVTDHFVGESFILEARMEVDARLAQQLLAPYDATWIGDAAPLRFIDVCRLPGEAPGLHLALATDTGRVAAVFMPDRRIEQRKNFRAGEFEVRMVPAGNKGSVVLFARDSVWLAEAETLLASRIRWL